MNLTGVIICKATKVGSDTVLSKITEMVKNAQSSKAPIERLADSISGIFVPVVLLISLITFITWLMVIGLATGFGEALPMALMRPLSGSGSLGIMSENLAVYGPDSFIGILVSTFYGSTETTFYVLALYFGAVNIKNTRHALPVGLIADVAGILAALFIVKLLFS